MAIIKKKCWSDWFSKFASGERTIESRLADFELQQGDELILQEYDFDKKQYTGRELVFVCKRVEKTSPASFYTFDDLQKYGLYLIQLEEKS